MTLAIALSSKGHWPLLAMGVLWGALSTPRAAHAEAAAPAAAALSEATKAYEDVDYARAYELGQIALSRGQASVQESIRLYTLLGISSAALGKADEARRYFITALAIDPTRELEQSLSPRVRAPYLEAKGSLSLYKEPLRLLARVQRAGTYLVVRLEDPLGLVKSLSVQTRAPSAAAEPLNEPAVELPAQPENRVLIASPLAEVGFEYRILARDPGGNVLAEIEGNQAAQPAHHSEPAVATPDHTAAVPRSSSWAWLPPTLGGAGVLALAASAYFQLERERAAREWNGPQCERPGQTRIEQCRSVDERRRRMQTLAVSGAAAGGALLLSGALAFFIDRANSSSELGGRSRAPQSRSVEVGAATELSRARSGSWSCGVGGLALHCFGQF